MPANPLCKNHRGYRALRRPRVACEPCWRAWFDAQRQREKAAKAAAQAAYDATPQGQIEKREREYNKYDDPNSCWYG